VGLAFDSSGDLFVVNNHTSYIDEYSSTGTLINAFAGNPGLPGADPNLRQATYIVIATPAPVSP
jgi:hypothetical protein